MDRIVESDLQHDTGTENEREQQLVLLEERTAHVGVEIVGEVFLQILQSTGQDFGFETITRDGNARRKSTTGYLSLMELM